MIPPNHYQDLDDHKLINLIQSQDENESLHAMDAVYRRYYGHVLTYTRSKVFTNIEDAEDISSDVWIYVSKHIFEFEFQEGVVNLKSWLFSIVRVTVLNYFGKVEKTDPLDQYLESSLIPTLLINDVFNRAASIEDPKINECLGIAIQNAIDALSEAHRLIIEMRYYLYHHKAPFIEIATKLNYANPETKGASKARQYHARAIETLRKSEHLKGCLEG